MSSEHHDISPNNGPLDPTTPTPVRSAGQRFVAFLLVLSILLVGIGFAWVILHSKSKPERKQAQKSTTLVQVVQVQQSDVPIQLEALGTVVSARELELSPSVSGTVLSVSPQLIPGMTFQKGDLLVELDPRDYQLALTQKKNLLEQASMDLRIEEGNQAVARREYELIEKYSQPGSVEAQRDLALRAPQLAQAKAAVAAAQSDYELAQLNLERTRITAPFNCIILEKNVAEGAQVTSQTNLATLAGTDQYWVRVSLPREHLNRIQLPEDTSSSPPTVQIANLNDTAQTPAWQGHILRLLGDVDPQGLMARLLISVPHPAQPEGMQTPLLLDSIVRASIPGIPLKDCATVPRNTLRNDDTVLVVNPGQKLDIRPVQVAWKYNENVYISEGLNTGDKVITSPIAAPIQGMPLRVKPDKDNSTQSTGVQ